MKRIFYFILSNILIMATLLIVASVVSMFVDIPVVNGNINLVTLAIFSLIFGFGGAFLSLAISKFMAKLITGAKVIDPSGNISDVERQVLNMAHRLATQAGLRKMPEVAIYDSKEVNAFATGPSRNRALVAVSTGMLDRLDEEAIEAVIAHEIAHIKNGDMVTMTLLQGLINTFVIFLSRVVAHVVSGLIKSEKLGEVAYYFLAIVFDIIFSILGALLVMKFSRHREYRADAGAAELVGAKSMAHALKSLKLHLDYVDSRKKSLNTMMISGKQVLSLFSTHPPLDERIRRLENNEF